jgi:hypothetical protein
MKYPSYIDKSSFLSQLAFYSLLLSGAYIILLWSPNVLGNYFSRWTKIIIYIFPWMMLCLAHSWRVLSDRGHRLEIILSVAIIILGVVNTAFSDSPSKSLSPMCTFLFTGIFAFWAAMFVLNDQYRRKGFDYFCACCLAITTVVELITWWTQGVHGPLTFKIFTWNPIPLGTLIILLSPGPIRLILSKLPGMKLGRWLLAGLGGIVIVLTRKRGTLVALLAMCLAWVGFSYRRLRYIILSLILAITLMLPIIARQLVIHLDPKIPSHFSILHHLELYPFAWHVWQSHPVMGMGLRAFTHGEYLVDYQQYNKNFHEFSETAVMLQTFDNMLLTSFVELGTVMTVLYLALILFIIVKYCQKLRSLPESTTLDWYRVLVLIGFACHSLTYDSLLLPSVNWLFHVQLGIMAGYLPQNDEGECGKGAPARRDAASGTGLLGLVGWRRFRMT